MGWLDKVKEVATKAKCATGFHAGDFTQVAGKPKCHLEKTCPDCNKHIEHFAHEIINSEQYDQPSSCVITSKCKHCEFTRSKEVHESFYTVGKDSYCRIKERCSRCGHTRIGREDHTWVKMTGNYSDETEKYSCASCNKEEIRKKVRY